MRMILLLKNDVARGQVYNLGGGPENVMSGLGGVWKLEKLMAARSKWRAAIGVR